MRQRDADHPLPRLKALFVRRTTPRPAGTEGSHGSQHAWPYSATGSIPHFREKSKKFRGDPRGPPRRTPALVFPPQMCYDGMAVCTLESA